METPPAMLFSYKCTLTSTLCQSLYDIFSDDYFFVFFVYISQLHFVQFYQFLFFVKLSLVSIFLSMLVYILSNEMYDKAMSNADFYKRVAIVCKSIPYGKVATYGQIALLCQKPQNSRQVGFALGRKIKEDVNAHRVINSQGYLSGAGSFDIYHPQKRLLEEEGVEVSGELRVDLKVYGWKHTLDDVLFFDALFKKMTM